MENNKQDKILDTLTRIEVLLKELLKAVKTEDKEKSKLLKG